MFVPCGVTPVESHWQRSYGYAGWQEGYELQRQYWQEAKFSQRRSASLSALRTSGSAPKPKMANGMCGFRSLEEAYRFAQTSPLASDQDWEELRAQAQQLAAAYFRVGRPALRRASLAPSEAPIVHSLTSSLASTSAEALLTVLTDPVSRFITRSLRERKRFLKGHSTYVEARCDFSTLQPRAAWTTGNYYPYPSRTAAPRLGRSSRGDLARHFFRSCSKS